MPTVTQRSRCKGPSKEIREKLLSIVQEAVIAQINKDYNTFNAKKTEYFQEANYYNSVQSAADKQKSWNDPFWGNSYTEFTMSAENWDMDLLTIKAAIYSHYKPMLRFGVPEAVFVCRRLDEIQKQIQEEEESKRRIELQKKKEEERTVRIVFCVYALIGLLVLAYIYRHEIIQFVHKLFV